MADFTPLDFARPSSTLGAALGNIETRFRGRPLAATVLRGLHCGARTESEVRALAPDVSLVALHALVARKPVEGAL